MGTIPTEDQRKNTSSNMNLSSSLVFLGLCLVLLSLAEARPSSGSEDKEEMTDALKYLEELDKYYSQVARPRQRRVGQNISSALKKLTEIKNFYNEAARPRFGKRSSYGYPAAAYSNDVV